MLADVAAWLQCQAVGRLSTYSEHLSFRHTPPWLPQCTALQLRAGTLLLRVHSAHDGCMTVRQGQLLCLQSIITSMSSRPPSRCTQLHAPAAVVVLICNSLYHLLYNASTFAARGFLNLMQDTRAISTSTTHVTVAACQYRYRISCKRLCILSFDSCKAAYCCSQPTADSLVCCVVSAGGCRRALLGCKNAVRQAVGEARVLVVQRQQPGPCMHEWH